MKKFFALLLSVVLMLSMLTPALAAYTAPDLENTTINHSMTLRETDVTELQYNITYSFAVSDVEFLDTDGIFSQVNAVTGKPSIPQVTYGPADNFNTESKKVEKELTVDWSGVTVTQPGSYRWTVTPSVNDEAAPEEASCANAFYLYLYVTDNNGTLNYTIYMAKEADADNKPTKKSNDIEESYPATTVDLKIMKTVMGSQGSKDQYFPFRVVLRAPGTVTDTSFVYDLSGSYTINVPQTAYNPQYTNPEQVTVENGMVEFTVYLKHGEYVTVEDMIFNTSYSVTESGNEGYVVTHAHQGTDNDGTFTTTTQEVENTQTNETDTITFATVADSSMSGDVVLSYTNTKDPTVPTGINLESNAAYAGIILAMGLMIVMFISKRKEQAC